KVARDWTIRCLKEYCSFSNSEYFLLGADEWQAPDHLLAREDFSVAKAWTDQVNLAVEYIVSQKRIPIVWHDMLVHYPETMKLLSKDAVIGYWFYDEDSDYAVMDTFKRHGFQVIMASGMCCGPITRRKIKAINSSIESMKRHEIDMFMMTSWENSCWERETVNIPLVGKILRNEELPGKIIEATSLYELIEHNPGSVMTSMHANRINELLKDKEWKKYPELHDFMGNMVNRNYEAVLDSFNKYHFSEGPIYNRIKALLDLKPVVGPMPSPRQTTTVFMGKDRFALIVQKDSEKGEWIRFVNNDESFDVYPKFGGTLQNWRFGDEIIIADNLDARLKKGRLPEQGGYKSYNSIGGFRPIWALGTHSNPCITWNFPFSWKIIADSNEVKTLELSGSFYHVDVTYQISIKKGTTGFTYSLKAVNRLDFTYGAFNFNLLLAFNDSEISSTSLQWEEGGKIHKLPFGDVKDSLFVIPARRFLEVKKQNYQNAMDCGESGGSGFYVDWSSTFMTPDFRGIYKPMEKGAVTETHWTFSVNIR
ncbi:MAG: hypothetical protein WCP55_08955, partial [Lentisphaerota bacterium]